MAWQALADLQQGFIASLLNESLPLPKGWCEARFAIYRNAYRARVVDAIRDTYPRTARWVGDEAFRRAAIHHVIQHPPRSWTLDTVGEGMPATLAGLFSNDPEVCELAWLEWAMHRCFVSADCEPVDVAGFQQATAAFGEDNWAELCLEFVPGMQLARVCHRIDTLWQALADDETPPDPAHFDLRATEPFACIVWRQGLTPVYATVTAAEGDTLALMLDGARYGDACSALACTMGEDAAIREAGAMLARWIHSGFISAVRSPESA